MNDTILDTSPARLCDCGCGQSFIPPPSAPHKRFLSERHRNAWHAARREEAYRRLRQAEQAEARQREEIERSLSDESCEAIEAAKIAASRQGAGR